MAIRDVQSSSMNIVTYGPCDAVIRTNKGKVYKRSEIEQWSFWGPEQTLSPIAGSHKTLSKWTLQCAEMFQTPWSTTTVAVDSWISNSCDYKFTEDITFPMCSYANPVVALWPYASQFVKTQWAFTLEFRVVWHKKTKQKQTKKNQIL